MMSNNSNHSTSSTAMSTSNASWSSSSSSSMPPPPPLLARGISGDTPETKTLRRQFRNLESDILELAAVGRGKTKENELMCVKMELDCLKKMEQANLSLSTHSSHHPVPYKPSAPYHNVASTSA